MKPYKDADSILLKPQLARNVLSFLVLELIAVHFLLAMVVAPNLIGRFYMYVPSRLGGDGFFMETNNLILINLAVIIAVLIMTFAFNLFDKKTSVTGMFVLRFIVIAFSSVYLMQILGNVFSNLFDSSWLPYVGIAIGLASGVLLTVLLSSTVNNRPGDRRVNK